MTCVNVYTHMYTFRKNISSGIKIYTCIILNTYKSEYIANFIKPNYIKYFLVGFYLNYVNLGS